MAIATEIREALSSALRPTKRDYELTEQEYIQKRVAREITQYERAIDYEKKELQNLSPNVKPITRQKKELTINMWGRQLARLKSGEWQKVNASYLHEQYAKMVKKAISTGQPIPQNIINQAPEYKAAQTARERYEKGWHTSFANRSVAINEQMKQELGYKVKRQDGKPIVADQLDEIAKGVGEVEKALGPLHDLFDKTDITIVHTSGRHPFLTGVGGTYTSSERAVNVGVAGVNALGHELGHWLDHESGKVENLKTRLWGKTGRKAIESTSTAEASPARYRGQEVTPLGRLIEQATYNINEMHEVRDIMKADYAKGLSDEEKAKTRLIRERLSPYWREPREVWARLVEQYIATKNQGGGVATDPPSFYEKTPGWWTKEEFAKLIPQVESQIKARIRVLRGSDVIPPRHKAAPKLEEFAEEHHKLEESIPVDITLPKLEVESKPTKSEYKEPWQMTRKEVLERGEKEFPTQKAKQAGYFKRLRKWHISQVEQAIKEGKPIPAEVLKDYPELVKREFKPGEFYKVDEKGHTVYVEVQKPIEGDPGIGKGQVFVATRTPWRTSMYGQIETAGWIDPEKLQPFKNTKADQKIIADLKHVQEEGVKRSEEMVKTLKAMREPIGREEAKPEPKEKPKPSGKEIAKGVFDKVVLYGGLPVRYSTVVRHLDEVARATGEKDWMKVRDAGLMGFRQSEARQKIELPEDVEPLTYDEFKKVINLPSGARVPKAIHRKWITIHPKEDRGRFKAKKPTKEKLALQKTGMALIDKIQASRTPRAILIDNALLARQVVPIDSAQKWLKAPNRYDIQGVDTPSHGRIVAGVAYADKGKKRLSRKHHRGWKKIKFT